MDIEKEKIINLHKQWLETEKKDHFSILQFCSDDVEFESPDRKTIKGKDEIRKVLAGDLNVTTNINILSRKVLIIEDLAALIAAFETTSDDSSRPEEIIRGKHLWVLKKISSDWKVAKVCWEID